MGVGEYYFQCQRCGRIHKEKIRINIDDDELFLKMECKHCRDDTEHLWVGETEIDIYQLYNSNIDPRFY